MPQNLANGDVILGDENRGTGGRKFSIHVAPRKKCLANAAGRSVHCGGSVPLTHAPRRPELTTEAVVVSVGRLGASQLAGLGREDGTLALACVNIAGDGCGCALSGSHVG